MATNQNTVLSKDPCSDSQRKNGGTCVDNEGVRECKCPKGFIGKNCDKWGKSNEFIIDHSVFIR